MPKISVENFLYSDNLYEDLLLSSSSSDYDSGGEECECRFQEYEKNRGVLDGLSDLEFKNVFQISRRTFHKILEILHTDEQGLSNCCENASMELVLLILLRFLSSVDSMMEIYQRFNVPTNCLQTIIKSAVEYFSTRKGVYVAMPQPEELSALTDSYQKIGQIKGVIGVLGVFHVKIKKPHLDSQKYLSSPGCYTLQIQGLVTVNYRFIDCFIAEGSIPNTDLLSRSPISTKMEDNLFKGHYVIADKEYNVPWVITPSREKHLLSNFNSSNEIDLQFWKKCFEYVLKRFKRLQVIMNEDVGFVSQCIETALILHNICVDFEDECNFHTNNMKQELLQFEKSECS